MFKKNYIRLLFLVTIPNILFCPMKTDHHDSAHEQRRLTQIVLRYGSQTYQTTGLLNQRQLHVDLLTQPEAITTITIHSAEERLGPDRCTNNGVTKCMTPYVCFMIVAGIVFTCILFIRNS